jgi:hypothetical protein
MCLLLENKLGASLLPDQKLDSPYRRGVSLGAVTNLRFIGEKKGTLLDCVSVKRR